MTAAVRQLDQDIHQILAKGMSVYTTERARVFIAFEELRSLYITLRCTNFKLLCAHLSCTDRVSHPISSLLLLFGIG